jgi:hypothetical protein
MYDLLLSRYHNIDFVMRMDLPDGMELYAKAREKRREERLYQAWVSLYPHFDKDNFVSWDDYRNRHNQIQMPVSRKSAADLIAEAADIKRQIEGR